MNTTKTIFLCLCLSALVSFGIVRYTAPTVPSVAGDKSSGKETTFQRVMRTRTIRCGYVIAREFLRFDPKTQTFSGPAYDVTHDMADNLGLKVEWAGEVAPATMNEDLNRGRYDMVCTPLTANAARGKVLFFSDPVFFNPIYLWVKRDDIRAKQADLSWVNKKDVTVAVIDGTSFHMVARKNFPSATLYSMSELSPISDMLMAVQTGKADATLAAGIAGDFYSRQNDNALVIAGDRPVYIQNHHYPLPHGDEGFRNLINVALGELVYTGEVEKILRSYDTTPPRYYMAPTKGYQEINLSQ